MTWKTGNLFVEEEESWWCSLFLSSQHRGLSMALFVALKMKYVNILSWKRLIVNRPVTAFSCAGVFFSNQLKDQFARRLLPDTCHKANIWTVERTEINSCYQTCSGNTTWRAFLFCPCCETRCYGNSLPSCLFSLVITVWTQGALETRGSPERWPWEVRREEKRKGERRAKRGGKINRFKTRMPL